MHLARDSPRCEGAWIRTFIHELLIGPVERPTDLDQAFPSIDDAPEAWHSHLDRGGLLGTSLTYRAHTARFGDLHGFVHVLCHPAVLVTQAETDHGIRSWADHTRSWIEARALHPHVVVRVEDLHADPVRELTRIAAFFGVSMTETALEATVACCPPPVPSTEEPTLHDESLDRVADQCGDTMRSVGYAREPNALVTWADRLRGIVPLPSEAATAAAAVARSHLVAING